MERDEESQPREKEGRRQASPHLWVSTTYFAEGLPYTIVVNLPEILFQQLGASLQAIGLTALFHVPWNLKFLWGPLLDRFETKRAWLIGLQLALAALLVLLALLVGIGAVVVGALVAVFLLLGFLAATHDIAIDGYYLEGLDAREQSRFVGYRAMTWKASNLVGRGPLLGLAHRAGWGATFLAAAVAMLALGLLHLFWLPRVERRGHRLGELARRLASLRLLLLAAAVALAVALEREHSFVGPALARLRGELQAVPALAGLGLAEWIALALLAALLVALGLLPRIRRRIAASDSYYARAFVDFLAQPGVGRILAFVVLFRTGESFLQKMRWPFLNAEMGMDLGDYAWASGTLGLGCSFVATFVGGWLIARHGLRRWVWPFVLAQNLLNLLYVWLAAVDGPVSMNLLAGVIAVEEFGAGLGTAVLMVYLMRCCDPAHKAAHFAILSALMSVSFTLAGVGSGFLAHALGFPLYFAFTFAATLPMMGLLFVIPRLDEPAAPVG